MEFLKIWEILVRRKWIVIAALLVFTLTTYICVKSIDKSYVAKAKVLVQSSDTSSIVLQALGLSTTSSSSSTSASSSSSDPYATDIALAVVRPVLDKVITKLQLVDRKGETIDPDDFANIGLVAKLKYRILPRPYIEVEQYNDSSCDMLEISAYSTSPEQAAEIANTLVAAYVEDRTRRTREDYKGARLYLQSQIQNVKKEYNQSLAEYRDFKIREKSIDLGFESQSAVNVVSVLMTKRNELMVSIAEKSADYTPDHPEIQRLKKDVEAVDKLLNEALTASNPIAEKYAGLSKIELRLSVNKDIYQKLLEYFTQVEIAESMTLSNIKLVESADVPTKVYFPVGLPLYILGSIFGLFWGTTLAFFVEYIDNTIKTPDDIKHHFKNLPLLGSMPKSKELGSHALISDLNPTMPIVEAFRTIRNSILFASVDKPLRSLLVTSSLESEGKSSIAVNLAISYAMEDKKVIIVDFDLRRPALDKYIGGASGGKGLMNVIAETASLEETITKSKVKGLDVLTSGPIPSDPSRLVESQKIVHIVETLKNTYDVVILDMPPIMAVNDALVVGKNVDGVVMVIEHGRATFTMIEHSLALLQSARLNVIGAVINKFKTHKAAYRYRYYDRYYRK